jgi:PPOX class probable F420-dependent enzyme
MISVSVAAQSFLIEQRNLILATVRRDGSPQQSPLWYLWTGSAFVMSTIESTAKWANLNRDPRCSVCVDEPESGKAIVAYGRAHLQSEDVRDLTFEIVKKYYPQDLRAAEDHITRILSGPKRVLISVIADSLIERNLDIAPS